MTPQSVLFSTNSFPPSVNTSTPVGSQKRWIKAPVLHSSIPSSNMLPNSHWYIKSCEIVKNKVVGLTAKQVMGYVIHYDKVPVTIQSYNKDQSYAKTQSYAKAAGKPSDPKSIRCADVAATASTSEGVAGLKINYDGTVTLDEKIYPLKAFIPEEIYLGKLSKVFRDASRENNMAISLKPDEKNNN